MRELRRVIEHVLAFSGTGRIRVQDLPATVTGDYVRNLQPSLVRDDSMRAWGSRYARMVLDRCGNNKREACRILGISYHTLQAYLRYGGGATTGRSSSLSDAAPRRRGRDEGASSGRRLAPVARPAFLTLSSPA